LDDERYTSIWHNGKFDIQFLRHYLGTKSAKVGHDTMLQHYLLCEDPPHGLKELAMGMFGAPAYEDEIHSYLTKKKLDSYRAVPTDVLHKYLAYDVYYTRLLHQEQWPKIESDPTLENLYLNLILPAVNLLSHIEYEGLGLDLTYLDKVLRKKMLRKMATSEKALRQLLGKYWDPKEYKKETGAKTAPEEVNFGSTKQLAYLLWDKLQFELPPGFTQTSTSIKYLKKIRLHMKQKEVDSKVLDNLISLRSSKKVISTYVEGFPKLVGPDERIHAFYNLHGTVTGRLATTGPNLTNIHRVSEVKDMIAARKGYLFLESDYSQLELRILAVFSQDTALIGAFKKGLDLHDLLSIRIFGPNFTDPDRHRAKTVNFGIPYGRSAYTIGQECGISTNEAGRWIRTWESMYVRATAYLKEQEKRAMRDGVLESPFGRRRRFRFVPVGGMRDLRSEARNFRIQSTASDITLTSALLLEGRIPKKWKIVNLIHDAILFEIPETTSKSKIKEVVDFMSGNAQYILQTDLPFPCKAELGPRWGSMKKLEL